MQTRFGIDARVLEEVELLDRCFPGIPVCVKIGRLVATCALPTARNTLRSTAVISSHEPISPNTPAG